MEDPAEAAAPHPVPQLPPGQGDRSAEPVCDDPARDDLEATEAARDHPEATEPARDDPDGAEPEAVEPDGAEPDGAVARPGPAAPALPA
ncbi:hypothetical protein IPZ61_32385, partial [Streptomyces sioyaensis]|nr:hypothetical protein [Streptomyces sioyaensis]